MYTRGSNTNDTLDNTAAHAVAEQVATALEDRVGVDMDRAVWNERRIEPKNPAGVTSTHARLTIPRNGALDTTATIDIAATPKTSSGEYAVKTRVNDGDFFETVMHFPMGSEGTPAFESLDENEANKAVGVIVMQVEALQDRSS